MITLSEKEQEIKELVEQLRKKYPSGSLPSHENSILRRKTEGLVPEIKRERLEALAFYIKPVLRYSRNPETDELTGNDKGKLLFYSRTKINPYDWEFQAHFEPGELAKGLKQFEEIGTYHGYAAPVMCRASIADVIAQLPENLIGRVVAFEINHLGSLEEYEDEKICPLRLLPFNWGFHYARTRLYEK